MTMMNSYIFNIPHKRKLIKYQNKGGDTVSEIKTEEMERQYNDYQSYISTYVDGFISKIFSNGIINEIEADTLKRWFSSPDQFQKELERISEYYYISNGEIFQLFDLSRALPTMNYKVDAFDKTKNYDKHAMTVNKIMYKVRHKTLTRDLISQTILAGTLCGIWLGDKNNPYFYIFDDLDHVFPHHMENGKWIIAIDMNLFTNMTEYQREIMFSNLSPYISEDDFKKYQSNREKYQYKFLPQDRSAVLRTHALKRNQNRGTGWATQGLYDILHKKKLKDLEKAVANKIINAVAVLKIGSDKNNGEYSNLKLPKGVKKKVHSGVKTALEKSSKDGITVVAIPDFADIEFPDIKAGDSLDPKKFESIVNDITSSLGLSQSLLNGTGSNFASAKINIDAFYRKLGVLLDDIETEVYGKLLNLILPANQSDNFYIEYDKEPPITNKEKIDILMKLHSQEGFSLKAVIDTLSGVSFSSYVEQSVYEQEVLKLQDKIKPYASAYTNTGDGESGRPSNENPYNENTIRSKENDGNNVPE